MLRHTAVALSLLVSSIDISAQSKVTITPTVQVSFPQGDYKQSYPKSGSGMTCDFMFRQNGSEHISLGFVFGIMTVDAKRKAYNGYINNRYDEYRIYVTNNIFSLAGKLRYEFSSPENAIQFYGDFIAGMNLFLNSRSITAYSVFLQNDLDYGNSPKLRGAPAFIAGAGLGFSIPVGKRKIHAIILKGSYIYGSNAKYYARPKIEGSDIVIDQYETKTDMLLAEAGLRFDVR